MLEKQETGLRFLQIIAPVAVFLLFASVFNLIYSLSAGYMVVDDIYYHAAHAISYFQGTVFKYPVFSTYSTRPVDLYYGYHWLMSLFVRSFDGHNFGAILRNLEFMNSLLASLYLTVLYLITDNLLRIHFNLSRVKSMTLAFVSVTALYAISPVFDFRLIIIRPHVFSSLFMLLSFYFVSRGKVWPIFLLSVILPFFYSLSLLLVIPPLVYAVCLCWYKQFKVGVKDWSYPLLFTLIGLLIGIMLRPDSLNYLYNGYFIHLMALVTSKLALTSEGTELYKTIPTYIDLLWFMPFAVSISAYAFRYIKLRSFEKTLSLFRFYLSVMTVSLFILFMVFNRASEYFFPFLALFVTLTLYEVFTLPVDHWFKILPKGNSVSYWFPEVLKELYQWFIKNKKVSKIVSITALILFFCSVTFGLLNLLIKQMPEDRYQAGAQFIEVDSGGQGIVFTQFFHLYGPLVFYNPKNQYIMGMGSIFTYEYSKELYYLWQHIVSGEKICPKENCVETDESLDLYDTLKSRFKANYVFMDSSTKVGTLSVDNTPKFSAELEKDARFLKVFTDPKYPEIIVYKL